MRQIIIIYILNTYI